MNQSPIVSVIIPAYNAELFLEDAIKSVLCQTFQDFEVIIVDDGSTDNTFYIASMYVKQDKRINLFRIKNTGLPSKVRNYAVGKANGIYLSFLDADDIWYPTKLEQQYKIIIKENQPALVYSSAILFGEVRFYSNLFGLLPLPFRAATTFDELLKRNTICCSSVLLKKNIFLEKNGFNENLSLKAVEDYDLWLRIIQDCKVAYCKRIHVKYRIHNEGISINKKQLFHNSVEMFKYRGYELSKISAPKKRFLLYKIILNSLHFIFIIQLFMIQYFKSDE